MQRLILMKFLVVLFCILFSGCLEESKLDRTEINGVTTSDYIWDDPGKYILSQNQLYTMFRETMDFKTFELGLLMREFETFLTNYPCYRRIVYEIYHTIDKKNANKAYIKVDANDSKLLNNPKLLARYDVESKTIIFRELEVGSLFETPDFVTLIHELMHHWQNLLFGANYLQVQYERNFEFEVIFLLDVASIQYQHRYASEKDEQALMYLKYDANNPVTYTLEEISEYVNAINSVLMGKGANFKDKLDSLAKNFKKYYYAVYTPWREYSLINRLY